jgi:hypothetical protein
MAFGLYQRLTCDLTVLPDIQVGRDAGYDFQTLDVSVRVPSFSI